jgi:hypothetical protein
MPASGVARDVIARITSYATSPNAVEVLVDEVVDLARRRSRVAIEQRKLAAEFFSVNTESGSCLSLLIGDDPSITAVVDLADHDGSSEELAVSLLQLGAPRDSGVVAALLGRIVRCPPHAVDDVSFNGDAVPMSPQIWARALLRGGKRRSRRRGGRDRSGKAPGLLRQVQRSLPFASAPRDGPGQTGHAVTRAARTCSAKPNCARSSTVSRHRHGGRR